jgi:hypothetical protein
MILWWAAVKWRLQPILVKLCTVPSVLFLISESEERANNITPTAIQDLLDELEASKQSRSRAWNVLQRFRTVLSEVENVSIPPPAQKTFEAKGETLEHALRNLPSPKRCDENSLFLSPSLSRRYNQGGSKRDYPQALQALWKALDRAEDLIQN